MKTKPELDAVMFLGFPFNTDDKPFCKMMRDILFGKKEDGDLLKNPRFERIYKAAVKARDEIGVSVGSEDAYFVLVGNKLRAVNLETKSQWYDVEKPGE